LQRQGTAMVRRLVVTANIGEAILFANPKS